MNREEIIAKHGSPRRVGTDGHVRLVDYMGGDAAVVQAARCSYGDGTKSVSDDRNLIRYLMRHRHTTPFEMVVLKFHVRVPMDTWRQWVRHRTASINEYSTRYSVAIDSRELTAIENWRLQSNNNKQGSAGFLIEEEHATLDIDGIKQQLTGPETADYLSQRELELHELSQEVYQERLDAGIAREQARKDLPLSTYTEAYWEMNLHNLLHFLRLRMHSHAQQEIREFACAIADIVKDVCPVTWEAFEDYALGGCFFSAGEMAMLREMLRDHAGIQDWDPTTRRDMLSQHIGTRRERVEFWKKING